MSTDRPHDQPYEPAPLPVRAQILATEHWSLLAARGLAWSESFSRATWFLTVVSAAVVAMALTANSTDFGLGFRLTALMLLPLLVAIGLATVVRLVQLNAEDVELVRAMNRLRRGYLDLAPELERYFVTGHTEDAAGIMQTYGGRHTRIPAAQYLSSIALLASLIVAVLAGALVSVVAVLLHFGVGPAVAVGSCVGVVAQTCLTVGIVRHVNHTWSRHAA